MNIPLSQLIETSKNERKDMFDLVKNNAVMNNKNPRYDIDELTRKWYTELLTKKQITSYNILSHIVIIFFESTFRIQIEHELYHHLFDLVEYGSVNYKKLNFIRLNLETSMMNELRQDL